MLCVFAAHRPGTSRGARPSPRPSSCPWHGAANQRPERVAAQDLRGLHHLLLVDHDSVGLTEHLGHSRVWVLHLLAAVLARHKARDQVHGTRAVQRVERDQVFQARGLGVAQHALHPTTFKLEHRFRLALLEQLVGRAVVERDVLEGEVLLARVALHDEVARDFQDGQRGQTQEVELHEAYGLHVVLVVLAHGGVAARLLVERAEVGELARGDQHAPGVHAHVACHAFELLRQGQQGLDLVFLVQALGELGYLGQRTRDRDVLARLVGNELGDAVTEGVAHVQHATDVADSRACGHGAEGGDLAHGFLAVLVLHVVDHPVSVGLTEVDVEVGHRDALGVQEALEQQLVFQRVQVRDLECIGHERSGT
jgi:hypothetical protein